MLASFHTLSANHHTHRRAHTHTHTFPTSRAGFAGRWPQAWGASQWALWYKGCNGRRPAVRPHLEAPKGLSHAPPARGCTWDTWCKQLAYMVNRCTWEGAQGRHGASNFCVHKTDAHRRHGASSLATW
eukprot:1140051-Pelagomonas_calceolata.AAC.2